MVREIYRGTTPKLVFTMNYETSLIDKIYITFQQKDRKPIEKDISDCELSGNKVTIQLSQLDTLSFVAKEKVLVQIRAKLTDGSAGANDPIEMAVKDVLKDGEI